MKAKLHIIFRRIDQLFNLEKGTAKAFIKNHFNIVTLQNLEREELLYLIRYCDNILLINEIDIDEEKKMQSL